MVVLSAMMGYYLPGVTSDPTKIFHLILGTLLIGGGAHVLNQWFEREQDARMRRTCQRPIPTGRVSEEEAILLGATLSIVGFSYLFAFTGWLTALLGAATHLTYLLLYTPLKQKTVANTWVGAITGALPPLMGWSAATGVLEWGALPIFAVLYLWQMPHFFAIAWMYQDEYRKGGFQMLSSIDKDGRLTAVHMVLHIALLILASASVFWFEQAGPFFLVVATLLGVGFLIPTLQFWLHRNEQNARKVFFASIIYLPAWCVVLTLDRIFL
jgi:protoheme IX farnesyltransferase